jgi:hypothetical protein
LNDQLQLMLKDDEEEEEEEDTGDLANWYDGEA